MRICQLLFLAYRRSDIVQALFRQLVHWEPDEWTTAYYEECLGSGESANEIMLKVLSLPEASSLYALPPPAAAEERLTVAQRMQYLLSLRDEDFIGELYRETLYREADDAGFRIHLGDLRQGAARMPLIRGFLSSEEWHMLLERRHIFSARILEHFLHSLQGVDPS